MSITTDQPAPSPATTADPALAQVLQRLQASRQALRAELLPPPEPPDTARQAAAGGLSAPLRRLWRQLRRAGRRSAVLSVLADATQGWWRNHPWRPAAQLLQREVQPVLRRHPLASVALAALAGAALVGLRPWRWPAVDHRLRPMPGRALGWLVSQLTSAPMQTALISLALMALREEPTTPPATATPTPTPTPTPSPSPTPLSDPHTAP